MTTVEYAVEIVEGSTGPRDRYRGVCGACRYTTKVMWAPGFVESFVREHIRDKHDAEPVRATFDLLRGGAA